MTPQYFSVSPLEGKVLFLSSLLESYVPIFCWAVVCLSPCPTEFIDHVFYFTISPKTVNPY